MEHTFKSCSLLFVMTCTCLVQFAFTKTTSHVVAALPHTTPIAEFNNVINDNQGSAISERDSSLLGRQLYPSSAAALLLYQFSGGKSHLSKEQFQSLLQCITPTEDCPTSDSPALLVLSNCTNIDLPHSQCQAFSKDLSRSELKEFFESVSGNSTSSLSKLEELLPAVVSKGRECAAVGTKAGNEASILSSRDLDDLAANASDASSTAEPGHKKATTGEVWGYGILFVTLISVCSLVGVSVLPLMARAMYQQMMTGLIGLAVGSLAASAAFHLLPQAYNLPELYGNHDYLFTSLYFLLGLWAFLMIERLIKICIMMHSARRQQSSEVKASPSAQGIINSGGSEDLPSPCPSVTVVSMRHQVACDPDQMCAPTAESKVDEMNRRNSSYHNTPPTDASCPSAQAKLKAPCGGYGAHDCAHHQADHCIIPRVECRKLDPDNDICFEELDNAGFCNNACCTNHAYRAPQKVTSDVEAAAATAHGTLKVVPESSSKESMRHSTDGGSTADVRHLGSSSNVSRSCSNDINCAGVICKPLEKEEVDLIFASQHQAIKASFGHEQKPERGGAHSHAAVEYRPGESSVIRTVAWMIIFGDGFHNFLDGVSIGAAFNASKMAGVSISLAVMCEELPHELGDFAVLLNAGMSMKQALMYNFLSALTCYAGLVVGILLGEFSDNSYYIFALAAGMFIYISCVDMVPELNEVMNTACEKGDWKDIGLIMLLQNLGFMLGVLLLFLLAYYQDQIAFD